MPNKKGIGSKPEKTQQTAAKRPNCAAIIDPLPATHHQNHPDSHTNIMLCDHTAGPDMLCVWVCVFAK